VIAAAAQHVATSGTGASPAATSSVTSMYLAVAVGSGVAASAERVSEKESE